MAAGLLRHQINILKPHLRLDQETGENITEYKRHHRKVPAGKEDVSGGTTRRGMQVESTVSTVFRIRFIEDIETSYRIESPIGKDGQIDNQLEIVSILDRLGNAQWLEIHCSEVV